MPDRPRDTVAEGTGDPGQGDRVHDGRNTLCLLAADMNSASGLGPVAAIGAAIALVAVITLFPALPVVFVRLVFWPVVPRPGTAEPAATGGWARIGRRVDRGPRTVWVTTVAVPGALAFGLFSLHATGLSSADSFTGMTPLTLRPALRATGVGYIHPVRGDAQVVD